MAQAKTYDTAEVEAHSRNLRAQISELERRQFLSDISRASLEQIAERRRGLEENVTAAIRHGNLWLIVKAEFKRDFSSVFDGFVRFDARVDAETMRHIRSR